MNKVAQNCTDDGYQPQYSNCVIHRTIALRSPFRNDQGGGSSVERYLVKWLPLRAAMVDHNQRQIVGPILEVYRDLSHCDPD